MSYHGCFFGRTGTGKSYKARVLAASIRAGRIPILTLAPKNQIPDWKPVSDWITDDVGRYCAKANASRRCALFMELSDAKAEKFDDRIADLFTSGRHLGHRCFFIAQRFSQVQPTIREQCSYLWLFKTGPKAAAYLAEEFADLTLMKSANLPDRCFLFKEGNAPARRVDCA